MAEGGALKALNIPQYFGETNKDNLTARAWTKQVNSCMKLSGWDSPKTAQFALLTLRSTAAIWANSRQELDSTVFDTWENLRDLFLKRFHTKKTLAELSYLKSTLVQNDKEIIRDFWDRCISAQLLFDETWGELAADATEDQKLAYKAAKAEAHEKSVQLNFIVGVNDQIRARLIIDQCKTSAEILDLAERIEASIRDQQRIFTDTSKVEVASLRGGPNGRGRGGREGRGGRGRGYRGSSFFRPGTCYRCGDPSHYADKCGQKGANTTSSFRGRANFSRGNRGFPFRGRNNYLRNDRTAASIHLNGNTGENSSFLTPEETHQQQQQQHTTSSGGSTNRAAEQMGLEDPYTQLSNAMISLNPLAH